MKKWLIPLIIVAVIGFGVYNWAVGFNNTAVEHEANAKTAWSNVESSYQRRSDLIGNLVSTVKGAADLKKVPSLKSLKHVLKPPQQLLIQQTLQLKI